jgi:hypothetical protein
VEIGTAGHAAAGSITIDSGVTVTMTAHFFAPTIVNGTLIVAAGNQTGMHASSLSGTGQIEIGSGAELFFTQAPAASAPSISFEGTGDKLTLYGRKLMRCIDAYRF